MNLKNERVFISTIPKAGKNLIFTFLENIGFSRFQMESQAPKEFLLWKSYAEYFPELKKRATWAAPIPNDDQIKKIPEAVAGFMSIISGMTDKTYTQHHYAFDRELHQALSHENIPIVFLYRDPRDILLSMANYFLSQGKPEHLEKELKGKSRDEIIMNFLLGSETLIPFSDYLESFSGWIHAEGVLSLRFEDLIGPLGGGTTLAQDQSFTKLSRHIHWEGSEADMKTAILNSFSTRAGTFFKGQIGAWAQIFSPAICREFDMAAGQLLGAWSYPVKIESVTILKSETERENELRQYFVEFLKCKEDHFHRLFDQTSNENVKLFKRIELLKNNLADRDREIIENRDKKSELESGFRSKLDFCNVQFAESQIKAEKDKELIQQKESQLNEHKLRIESFRNELKNRNQAVLELQKRIEELKNQVNELRRKEEELKTVMAKNEVQIDSIQKDIIAKEKSIQADHLKLSQQDFQIDQLKGNIGELENHIKIVKTERDYWEKEANLSLLKYMHKKWINYFKLNKKREQ